MEMSDGVGEAVASRVGEAVLPADEGMTEADDAFAAAAVPLRLGVASSVVWPLLMAPTTGSIPMPAGGDAIQLADISVASTMGAWESMLEQRLGNKWMLVHHVELMQMRLCIFCRRANKDLVRNVQAAKSATGIGGAVGNKGGLVISFTYGTTSLGFVSSHLAAHMGKMADRNADYWEVLRETRKQIGPSRLADATAARPERPASETP
jgi:hypothetical protein